MKALERIGTKEVVRIEKHDVGGRRLLQAGVPRAGRPHPGRVQQGHPCIVRVMDALRRAIHGAVVDDAGAPALKALVGQGPERRAEKGLRVPGGDDDVDEGGFPCCPQLRARE